MNIKIIFQLIFSLLIFLATADSAQNTPIDFNGFHQKLDLDMAEIWTPPNYENQSQALGNDAGSFSVPAGMEERVSFWLDIYTKYTSDQGVLHDSQFVNVVYEQVDFNDIRSNELLTDKMKSKLRTERVKQAKKRIEERLLKLQSFSSPAGLEGEDLRYWYMFSKVSENNKFKEASKSGRLRFQLGQKDRFLEGIYHSGRYIQEMERIFKDYQLPLQLTRLPFVESSFNLNARSRVGASGIWQFMRSTGKQYLKIDSAVDERNDPIRATEAAAKKMQNNFGMLGNWPLAVTGYNHGPYGLSRLMKKQNTDNLVDLLDLRKGTFGFASASFYASFLAAVEAEKRAEKYFGVVFREKPLKSQRIYLDTNFSSSKLIELFNNDEVMARKFNPHLLKTFWSSQATLRKGHYLSIPQENNSSYISRYEMLKTKQTLSMVQSSPVKFAKLESIQNAYEISKGDTLSKVALNFGIDVKRLMDANGITDPRSVQIGQKILIPENN
jgi:membrane-bound lytic murein transglycosylase D